MKTTVLSREKTDYARPVYEFVEMYKRKYPDLNIEVVDLDTREGADMATMYAITEYPAVLTIAEGGRVIQIWQGTLPLFDEVAASALG